jgi:hypothetical protein
MPHNFASGQKVRLSLSRLELPAIDTPPPWVKSFQRAKTLTRSANSIVAVALQTSVYRSGGTPDLARSFAVRESLDLVAWAEQEIGTLIVPQKDWRRLDKTASLDSITAQLGNY